MTGETTRPDELLPTELERLNERYEEHMSRLDILQQFVMYATEGLGRLWTYHNEETAIKMILEQARGSYEQLNTIGGVLRLSNDRGAKPLWEQFNRAHADLCQGYENMKARRSLLSMVGKVEGEQK